MITSKTTVFFIFLVVALGSWMFYLKYAASSIEDRIAIAKRNIENERSNAHILYAEWKALTTPERIQRLAVKHLGMQQISPAQLKEFDLSIFRDITSEPKEEKKVSSLIGRLLKNLDIN